MPGTDGQTRWLSADEQQAWRATVHLSQLLMRQLDRDLNAHGLNGHDYEILVELSEAPDHRLRMTELADATSQSRSRLSHQIERAASTTTAAMPGAARPWPRDRGRTQTPCTWHTCGVTAPISALKMTSPPSILAKARPPRISCSSRAR